MSCPVRRADGLIQKDGKIINPPAVMFQPPWPMPEEHWTIEQREAVRQYEAEELRCQLQSYITNVVAHGVGGEFFVKTELDAVSWHGGMAKVNTPPVLTFMVECDIAFVADFFSPEEVDKFISRLQEAKKKAWPERVP